MQGGNLTDGVGVQLGNVEGGILHSIIAGGHVFVNKLIYGSGDDYKAADILRFRVKRDWIDGFLADSLSGRPRISLALKGRPDLLSDIVKNHRKANSKNPLPTAVLADVQHGESALILGEPGSGKTTALLESLSKLLELKPEDTPATIPVVIALSGWKRPPSATHRDRERDSEKPPSSHDWVVQRIAKDYRLPTHFVSAWLQSGRLAIFFDGLDEVEKWNRGKCVDAINDLLDHTLCSVYVSCRYADYIELDHRLNVERVSEIYSLTDDQIAHYIAFLPALPTMRMSALLQDPDLLEICRSPLMLGILAAVVEEFNDLAIDGTSIDDKREIIFVNHTRAMLNRKRELSPSQAATLLRTLRSIAVFLHSTSKTQFEVEDINSTLISTTRGKRLLLACTAVFASTLLLITFWLASTTGYLSYIRGHIYGGIIGCVVIAAIILGYSFYVFYSPSWVQFDSLSFSMRGSLIGASAGLLGILIWPLIMALSVVLSGLLVWLIPVIISFPIWLVMTIMLVLILIKIIGDIKVENAALILIPFCVPPLVALAMLWLGGANHDSHYGLQRFIFDHPFMSIQYVRFERHHFGDYFWRNALNTWWRISVSVGIVLCIGGILLGGIRPGQMTKKTMPGSSLVRSSCHSAVIALLAITSVMTIVLACHLIFDEVGSFAFRYSIMSLFVGAIVFAALNGPMLIRVLCLKAILSSEGTVAFDLVKTLEWAVRLILVRRIASGFVFIHKLQLDYFALTTKEKFDMLLQSIGNS